MWVEPLRGWDKAKLTSGFSSITVSFETASERGDNDGKGRGPLNTLPLGSSWHAAAGSCLRLLLQIRISSCCGPNMEGIKRGHVYNNKNNNKHWPALCCLFEAWIFVFLLNFNSASVKFQCLSRGAKTTELTHIHLRNIIHHFTHTVVRQGKAYLKAPLTLVD